MYSTVIYLIAFLVIAGGSGEKRTGAADKTPAAALYFDEGDAYQENYQSYSETASTAPYVEEAEAEAPEEDAAPAIIYESNPVVQDIPAAEEAPVDAADKAE